VGALLTLAMAGVIGYIAWHIVPRGETASGSASSISKSSSPASSSESASCVFPASSWIDQTGQKRPVADLKGIVSKHADFHKRNSRESPADLSCVDLRGYRLAGADLRGTKLLCANLSKVDLSGADLRLANLTEADLSDSRLDGANLEGDSLNVSTDLSRAKMKNVSFIGAKLKYAWFIDHADLSGANLREADLSGTSFTTALMAGTNVTKAQLDGTTDFENAELDSLVFEPANIPDADNIYRARGLEHLTFGENGTPKALTALRTSFHDAGMELQERKITYALRRANTSSEWNKCLPRQNDARALALSASPSNCAAWLLNTLVFDLTFQYGMSPNRPLYLVCALWLLCSIVYVVIIKVGKRSAIFLVCQRNYHDGRTILRRARIAPRPVNAGSVFGRFEEIVWREGAIWRVALFFSLQSTLNIGFQELELGRWLKLLTTREYDLKAEGWARSLAGAQSLLSILMLALSIWALFGQPFSS